MYKKKYVARLINLLQINIDDKIISDEEKFSFEVDSMAEVGRGYARFGDELLDSAFQ